LGLASVSTTGSIKSSPSQGAGVRRRDDRLGRSRAEARSVTSPRAGRHGGLSIQRLTTVNPSVRSPAVPN
jgi:hypothetical protein